MPPRISPCFQPRCDLPLRVDPITDRLGSVRRQPERIGKRHERVRHQPRRRLLPDRAELEVELGFADRNERQRIVLIRQSGGWLIDRIDKADTVKPPVPYDAPIFDTGGQDSP